MLDFVRNKEKSMQKRDPAERHGKKLSALTDKNCTFYRKLMPGNKETEMSLLGKNIWNEAMNVQCEDPRLTESVASAK